MLGRKHRCAPHAKVVVLSLSHWGPRRTLTFPTNRARPGVLVHKSRAIVSNYQGATLALLHSRTRALHRYGVMIDLIRSSSASKCRQKSQTGMRGYTTAHIGLRTSQANGDAPW